MNNTAEQDHILELAAATKDNLMIDAYAGTGKTTTLELIERAAKQKPVLYLVFNKRNAKEAEERMLSTTTVRTFNSLGHRIWSAACAKNLSMDFKKTQTILRSIIDESPKAVRSTLWEVFYDVVDAVARAKAIGYVPEGKYPNAKRLCTQSTFHASLESRPDDLVSDLIDAVLTRSIKLAYDGFIDFNDQIYMPALFGGIYPQFPLLLIDEYQDLNPTNHAMIAKLVGKSNRRLIGVGDPFQNIYGFRGAKAHGMEDARAAYSMTSCDLSISFRCPQAIVNHVKWHVPKFKANKEGGHVECLEHLLPADIPESSTFICRNNAPLFGVAFQLLGSGRSVSVVGSEIGPKLIGIMKKLGPEACSRQAFLDAIAEWEVEKLAKDSTSASDLAECMRVFTRLSDGKAQAIAYAEHLFAQQGSIQLLTGHKAKGLEYDCVYHLDPFLLDYGTQDKNLAYVIATRSKDKLFEIEGSRIKW